VLIINKELSCDTFSDRWKADGQPYNAWKKQYKITKIH